VSYPVLQLRLQQEQTLRAVRAEHIALFEAPEFGCQEGSHARAGIAGEGAGSRVSMCLPPEHTKQTRFGASNQDGQTRSRESQVK
jgi:hypothetical protein